MKQIYFPDQEDNFYLHILTINPEYQRRGVGGKLLEWGTQQADKHNEKIYLEASPAGRGLYLRHGFEIVGTLEVGSEDREGGIVQLECMMREPKQSK